MQRVKVVSITRLSAADQARILAVDPVVELVDAGGWFDGEYRETWPAFASARYLAADAGGRGTREERDRLLAEADVVLGGWPFPLDLGARAHRLKWFHQRVAGASNLRLGDLWERGILITTSRGAANSLAIAEYAVAGLLHFAKGFHRAAADREQAELRHRTYRSLLIAGKTVCVVGVGGIGREVGRLCAAIGMRVVGTRSVRMEDSLPAGFDAIEGPDSLDRLLAKSDFAVIACQWTPETTGLFNRARFAAMKPGSVVVNVARGEIVDEDALLEALDSGHLRGAVLDVYIGEFERPPPARLWQHPNVLLTPHVSAASDEQRSGAVDLFCENLRAWLDGRPLQNVIDWKRGY